MIIYEMTEITEEVCQAFNRLIPQLTLYSQPPTREMLTDMMISSGSAVFLARYPDVESPIVGSATLGVFLTPTGFHGWIEDVIVDINFRRHGIGQALTEACLQKARQLGLKEVNLTSRPAREAANLLYLRMGFLQRETNVYRYPIG